MIYLKLNITVKRKKAMQIMTMYDNYNFTSATARDYQGSSNVWKL